MDHTQFATRVQRCVPCGMPSSPSCASVSGSPAALQRLLQMYNRMPDYQLVRMAVTLLVAIVFGSLAWDQGSDT